MCPDFPYKIMQDGPLLKYAWKRGVEKQIHKFVLQKLMVTRRNFIP